MNRRLFIAAGLVLSMGAAACSSSSKSSSASATATTAAPSATLSVATKAGSGAYVVGSDGHTLYTFEKDTGTKSACTGACAAVWPGLAVSGTPTVGAGLDSTKVSTAAGQVAGQVVYNGHLLYDYSGDKAAGDTNGTKIDGWYLVSPAGDKIGT
ncbi:MAG: COG4315 family predicted lipoprotein [Acidimicrobiales bacterium]